MLKLTRKRVGNWNGSLEVVAGEPVDWPMVAEAGASAQREARVEWVEVAVADDFEIEPTVDRGNGEEDALGEGLGEMRNESKPVDHPTWVELDHPVDLNGR